MRKPLWFWMRDKFYSWDTGLEVAAVRSRTLVRCFPVNADFWTWIDDMGNRCWEIAKL